jgi:hypothetical protein
LRERIIIFGLYIFPTRNLYGPISKMGCGNLKSVFNRVPIQKIYFRLSERHNSNMSILSLGNPFEERILFEVLLLENMLNGY